MKTCLFVVSFLLCCRVVADPIPPSWDEERLAGFAEQKAENVVQDRERLKGQTADSEEREEWERTRKAALKEQKRQSKLASPHEGGKEFKEDQAEKKADAKEYEAIRQAYSKRKAFVTSRHAKDRKVSEAEELGLTQLRPRYNVKNRVLYGAKSKIKPGSTSGGSSYSGGGTSGGSGNANFPPPPNFDDFTPGDGYVPPPMPEENATDFPPPPPPPMPLDSGGMGGEFPPPPPPPDFGDFPPPAAMPPEGF